LMCGSYDRAIQSVAHTSEKYLMEFAKLSPGTENQSRWLR
jgi:hypothetical protein